MHFYTFIRSSFCSLWMNNKQHAGDPRYNYPLWSTSPVTTMRIKVNMLSGAMAFMLSLSSSKPLSWGRTSQSNSEMTHFLLQNHEPHPGKWGVRCRGEGGSLWMDWVCCKNICYNIMLNKCQHARNIQYQVEQCHTFHFSLACIFYCSYGFTAIRVTFN